MKAKEATVVGLSVPDLINISEKLSVLDLDTKDLLEFLDRDKIQLFAGLKNRIKHLEIKLNAVRDVLDDRDG